MLTGKKIAFIVILIVVHAVQYNIPQQWWLWRPIPLLVATWQTTEFNSMNIGKSKIDGGGGNDDDANQNVSGKTRARASNKMNLPVRFFGLSLALCNTTRSSTRSSFIYVLTDSDMMTFISTTGRRYTLSHCSNAAHRRPNLILSLRHRRWGSCRLLSKWSNGWVFGGKMLDALGPWPPNVDVPNAEGPAWLFGSPRDAETVSRVEGTRSRSHCWRWSTANSTNEGTDGALIDLIFGWLAFVHACYDCYGGDDGWMMWRTRLRLVKAIRYDDGEYLRSWGMMSCMPNGMVVKGKVVKMDTTCFEFQVDRCWRVSYS